MMKPLLGYLLMCVATLFAELRCCPDGWTEEGSLCLTYHTASKSWAEAESLCSSIQGHIVKVKDASENAALVHFRTSQAQRNNPVWLGMRMTAGSWQWYDGKPVTWASWEGGKEAANMGSETCGMLKDGGGTNEWSAFPCTISLAFICQYTEADSPISEQPTERSRQWQRLAIKGEYTDIGKLMTVASPSRITCAGQCQTMENCDAIGYHGDTDTCQLITGEVSSNQITHSADWELWIKKG